MLTLKLSNQEERNLIIAGIFIRQMQRGGKEPTDEEIFDRWNERFKYDFYLPLKKYHNQRFIYKEGSKFGCLTLPDTRYIQNYILINYNRLWVNCCTKVREYMELSYDEWMQTLTALRKKNEKHLKLKCTNLGGTTRMEKWKLDYFVTYHIWIDREEFIGNYQNCVDFLNKVKQERKSRGVR